MMRPFWIGFGAATHTLFAATVFYLFYYLRGEDAGASLDLNAGVWRDVLVDSLLAVQFAVSHSWLLLPSTRTRLARSIPGPAYGVFFCCCTCLSLLLTIACWRPIGGTLWSLQGEAFVAMRGAFYGAWIALLYSLYLSGFGYQTGWATWWPWIRGLPVARRDFRPRSIYLWLRHPVYFSFLGLIWFTPVMTSDRAVLTLWWTLYIFVGSYLKDRRLIHYIGDPYRAYQAQVPGYPGVFVGPLGRVALADDDRRSVFGSSSAA